MRGKKKIIYGVRWKTGVLQVCIQCKQKSSKVPAVVYNYVARQAVEEEGEDGVAISNIQKQSGLLALCGELMRWKRSSGADGKQEVREKPLLHDGSVNDGLDVVPSISRVDDPLPFGVLLDAAL